MTRNKLLTLLRRLGACSNPGDAIPWVERLPARTSAKQCWERCKRGDWLAWFLWKIGLGGTREARLAVLACAAEALPHTEGTPAYEPTKRCLDVTRRYIDGEATLEELRKARRAARAAADATTDAAAAYADAAARSSSLARSADIIREMVPWRVVREALR